MSYIIKEIIETFNPDVTVPRRMDLEEKVIISINGEIQAYHVEKANIEMLPWQTIITYTLTPPLPSVLS